jgi:glutamine amidotransferase-like uncharacterized protein
MKRSSIAAEHCAFFWDESFLWGIMSFNALKTADLPFDLVRSEDIRDGILRDYSMLFVPGGWASNKVKSLGDKGVQEIRNFVEGGGNYLGFCGGAGLATLDGIGLLNISRVPTRDRVPSFSGRIETHLYNHAIWNGLDGTSSVFNAWWPSQFSINDPSINVIAKYKEALPDSFSSDLNVGAVLKHAGNWKAFEHSYGINLDPSSLRGEPAVVEGNCGKGRVLLSLIHFDTPDDLSGSIVLKNIWSYLSGREEQKRIGTEVSKAKRERLPVLDEIMTATEELVRFGERNFLWFWRNPMLLLWRRGIRGLEYCTLYGMITTITDHAYRIPSGDACIMERLNRIKGLLMPFKEKAERLLFLERQALANGRITYEKCDDPAIQMLRTELFSKSKSYGGLFKQLLDEIDRVVLDVLKGA